MTKAVGIRFDRYFSYLLVGAFITFATGCGWEVEGNVQCLNGSLVATGSAHEQGCGESGGDVTFTQPLFPSIMGGTGTYTGNFKLGSILEGTIFGDTSGNANGSVTCYGAVCTTTVQATCQDGHVNNVTMSCIANDFMGGVGFTCNPSNGDFTGTIGIIGGIGGGVGGGLTGTITSQDGNCTFGGGCKVTGPNGFLEFGGQCDQNGDASGSIFCGWIGSF